MARVAQIELMPTHSVALNLAPLLAPHRKRVGRLSLRLERIPQGTRLSRGTRNNDNTWSLGSDELDDLALMMPAKAQQEFKIGVRVISLLDGATLATVELPVRPGDEVVGANVANPATTTLSPADAAELSVLRQELNAAKEKLAARDAELAERLAAAATEASNQFHQTLAKAEAGWTESENVRLAAIQQQWQDKFGEALHEIETAQAQAHDAKVRELQEKIDGLQAAVDQHNAALKEARATGAAARERGDLAAQDAHTKLTDVQAKLLEREAELARAVAATDAAKRDAEAALAKAENNWRDGEAARLAAAEAHWREASAKALADARAGAQELHAKGTAGERELLNQVAELKAAVAERDEALTRAQAASEQARTKAAQDAAADRTAAEANWKAAEAARLAAVHAEWQEKLENAVKSAHVEPAAVAAVSVDEAELTDLREKLASLQAKLALRDAAAARAAKLSEDEHRRWQKEAQDVIVKAARERRSDENARLAAAQSEWTKQSVRDLALASARAEAAEAALAQLRIRATEEAPLQHEVASLRSALAIREAELEHYRGVLPTDSDPSLATDTIVQDNAPPPRPNRMYRDALIAACVGIVAVILWPTISNMVAPPPAPQPTPPVVAVAAPAPVLAIGTATKDAKLRATPSIFGNIVGKLPRDSKIQLVETKGEWTHVRVMEPAKGNPVEGWAKSALLQEAPATPAKPAKKK